MKPSVALCLFLVGTLSSELLAHGGTFSGPRGGVPPRLVVPPGTPAAPPGIDCDCARPDCGRCSHDQLIGGERLVRREIAVQASQQWHDFARVHVTASFRAREGRPIEAYALLAPAALFAATGGSIRQGNSSLAGTLQLSRDARRRYLWAKQRGLDPFLLMRRGPGRYHLRAYPVHGDGDTVVEIEGVVLAEPPGRGEPRIYVTGDRVLVVRDPDEGLAEGEWLADGRALSFHDLAAARARYGPEVDRAVRVPFVPALETALTGKGGAAVCDDAVLIALEPGAELPPRVGPPEPKAPPARGVEDPPPPAS